MSSDYLSAIVVSIFIVATVGLGVYTGQGFLVLWIVGTIIMHFIFRLFYRDARDRNETSLSYCYQKKWCSEVNFNDKAVSVITLLIFSFSGVASGDFKVPLIVFVLGAEYFMFRRYYRKKAKYELEERAKYKFDTLIKKLYDRDMNLGACFERNVAFERFENDTLTWSSRADEHDRRRLIADWGLINMFVKDIFGFETKIVNISKNL